MNTLRKEMFPSIQSHFWLINLLRVTGNVDHVPYLEKDLCFQVVELIHSLET